MNKNQQLNNTNDIFLSDIKITNVIIERFTSCPTFFVLFIVSVITLCYNSWWLFRDYKANKITFISSIITSSVFTTRVWGKVGHKHNFFVTTAVAIFLRFFICTNVMSCYQCISRLLPTICYSINMVFDKNK